MNRIIFLISFVCIIHSCQSQKTGTSNAVSKKDSLLVSIYRYPCFGRCPYYDASLYKSGYAEINRKGYMDQLGVYATHFSTAEVKDILDEAKRIRFIEMPDSFYNPGIADFPAVVTSVRLNQKTKTIFDGVPEAPPTLKAFEMKLHNVFNDTTRVWKLIKKSPAED